MKRTTCWILISLVACAVGLLAAYRIGYYRGYDGGYRNGTVDAIGHCHFDQSVAFLAALQKLRAGDMPVATRFMEKVCFDSAHIFYKQPPPVGAVSQWGQAQGVARFPGAAMTKEVAQQLLNYRAAYPIGMIWSGNWSSSWPK